jgi:hypothetical protein
MLLVNAIKTSVFFKKYLVQLPKSPTVLTVRIHTVCFKDCGLHNRNIDMIFLFACLVGWLNSSPVEFF